MVNETKHTAESTKSNLQEKLKSLYALQVIHSKVDKIHDLMGVLPMEVQDLEDEIVGLKTRIENYNNDIEEYNKQIGQMQNKKAEADELIKKYNEQQMNVRNNREYEAISKEIEYQKLEIELADKRIKEYNDAISETGNKIESANKEVEEKNEDLKQKQKELDEIVAENKKDEQKLKDKQKEIETQIDDRYLKAFNRIRETMKNGLAVVTIYRDSCGGCFNRIPPQRQLDIGARRRIIVCEHCGRILVDNELAEEVEENFKDI